MVGCVDLSGRKNGMEQSFFVFNRIDVTVGPEEVLKQSGYPRADSAGAGFRKRVEVELTEVLRLIEPRGAYLLVDGARRMGLELFADAEKVVLALATVGPAIETRARTLVKDQQGAGALIVDAVGTIAAEKAADFIEGRIREHFRGQGWRVSRRYAPGYCGWDIKAQRELLAHFPDTVGIELTDSCLMLPEKSLSFVCLLGREDDFDWVKVGNCKVCGQEECSYRFHEYRPDSQGE